VSLRASPHPPMSSPSAKCSLSKAVLRDVFLVCLADVSMQSNGATCSSSSDHPHLAIPLPSKLAEDPSPHHYCFSKGRHSGSFYLKVGAAGKYSFQSPCYTPALQIETFSDEYYYYRLNSLPMTSFNPSSCFVTYLLTGYVLCLIAHTVLVSVVARNEDVWGSAGTAPHILNLGTSCR